VESVETAPIPATPATVASQRDQHILSFIQDDDEELPAVLPGGTPRSVRATRSSQLALDETSFISTVAVSATQAAEGRLSRSAAKTISILKSRFDEGPQVLFSNVAEGVRFSWGSINVVVTS
jgi:hypothetical protein